MIQILSFVIFTRMSHVSQCTKRAPPQFENHVQIFHLSSTDDERTGPGYMNQLACEQKKLPRARQSPLGQVDYREDGLPSFPKKVNQERRFVESKSTLTTSSLPQPICLLLSNWKSQSVVLPSKFNNKHCNLTRYQTAGHATWKVGAQHTMDDWTCIQGNVPTPCAESIHV